MASSSVQSSMSTIQFSPAPPPDTILSLLDISPQHHGSTTHPPSPMSTNHRFTLFPTLPKEVRDMIWKEALPGPRLIEIGWKVWIEELEDGTIVEYCKCIASSDHPAMLHTCHESRGIALKIFRLSFAEDLKDPVYFNIARDTLVFHSFATICLFLRNSGNHRPFQEGRIPTIALDPSPSSLKDCLSDYDNMRLGSTVEDFFTSGDAPDFEEELKFGLFDEIAVLADVSELERDTEASTSFQPHQASLDFAATSISLFGTASRPSCRQVAHMLQRYINELDRGFKESVPLQNYIPWFKAPTIIFATREWLLDRKSWD